MVFNFIQDGGGVTVPIKDCRNYISVHCNFKVVILAYIKFTNQLINLKTQWNAVMFKQSPTVLLQFFNLLFLKISNEKILLLLIKQKNS